MLALEEAAGATTQRRVAPFPSIAQHVLRADRLKFLFSVKQAREIDGCKAARGRGRPRGRPRTLNCIRVPFFDRETTR